MKKKIIIGIISVLIIVAGIGYFLFSKNSKDKELAYQDKLADTLELIESSTTESALLASTYQKYWGAIIKNAITFEKLSEGLGLNEAALAELTSPNKTAQFMYGKSGLEQGEFNTIISMVAVAKANDSKAILEQQDLITDAITDLKNPPEQFKNNYESLLEVYEVYDTFVSISTSPTGSYVEYSKKINSTYESLSSKTKTTKLQLQ